MSVHFSILEEQSAASEFGIDGDENEHSGVNLNQYPSYQSIHTPQTSQHIKIDPNLPPNNQEYEDDDDDMQNPEGKKAENFKQFIYKNNHQFKAIGGGELEFETKLICNIFIDSSMFVFRTNDTFRWWHTFCLGVVSSFRVSLFRRSKRKRF